MNRRYMTGMITYTNTDIVIIGADTTYAIWLEMENLSFTVVGGSSGAGSYRLRQEREDARGEPRKDD